MADAGPSAPRPRPTLCGVRHAWRTLRYGQLRSSSVATILLVVAIVAGACSGSTLEEIGQSQDPAAATTTAPTVAPNPVGAAASDAASDQPEPTPPSEPQPTPTPADPVPTAVEPAVRVPENTGPVIATNWVARTAMDADSVELVWSPVEQAEAYRVYRQLTRDADYDAVVRGDLRGADLVYEGIDLAWTDAEVPTGEFLTYVLVAQVVDGRQTEPRWTEALTVNDTEPPSAITGLVAESTPEGVLLTWNPVTDNVEFAAYSVSLVELGERRYLGGGASEAQTSFLDTDTSAGTRLYEVVASDFHDNQSTAATIEITRQTG